MELFQKLLIPLDFYVQQSLDFTQNDEKNKQNTSSEWQFFWETRNTLLKDRSEENSQWLK